MVLILLAGGSGGSLVAHLTVILQSGFKTGIPQPARTCQFHLVEPNRVGIATAGWPLRGGKGKKIYKNIA